MVRVPSFSTKSVEKPDPHNFLHKYEGSPAGLDLVKRRESASSSSGGSPKIARGLSSPSSRPQSPASPKKHPSQMFWKLYERGDLPVLVDQARPGKNGIKWKNELELIDLHYYLPVFLDGILETQDPCKLLAVRGSEELLTKCGERVLPVIPQLIMPLKAALKAADKEVVSTALRMLRLLAASCPTAGQALLPYYRQLLPPLNRHVGENLNIGDAIDYGQRTHKGSMGDVVLETLNALEEVGGPDAFLNIKYIIPTYQSSGKGPARK